MSTEQADVLSLLVNHTRAVALPFSLGAPWASFDGKGQWIAPIDQYGDSDYVKPSYVSIGSFELKYFGSDYVIDIQNRSLNVNCRLDGDRKRGAGCWGSKGLPQGNHVLNITGCPAEQCLLYQFNYVPVNVNDTVLADTHELRRVHLSPTDKNVTMKGAWDVRYQGAFASVGFEKVSMSILFHGTGLEFTAQDPSKWQYTLDDSKRTALSRISDLCYGTHNLTLYLSDTRTAENPRATPSGILGPISIIKPPQKLVLEKGLGCDVPRKSNNARLVGPIVGSVVGAFVLVGLVVGYVMVRRRRRAFRPPSPVDDAKTVDGNDDSQAKWVSSS